jgi:HSP20 family protein
MTLTRLQRPELAWPGFGRLSSLREELDRLFEWPLDITRSALGEWVPALDVREEKDSFVVQAELPGMKREDIEVSLHEGALHISGERKVETKHEDSEIHRTERFYGKFQRSVILLTAVAADKIKAQYKDGILTVTLPKTEESKPKKIDVSVS